MKSSIITSLIGLLLLNSCIKTNRNGSSALTIVNAIPGSSNLVTNFSGSGPGKAPSNFMWYSTALEIPYGSFAETGSFIGQTNLSISKITDTLDALVNFSINLRVGGVYTLFLTGADSAHVDTLFTTDIVPYYPYTGDSLTGVRFVNLVQGGNAINIDIQGTPNTSVLTNLGYKGISGFNPFSATIAAQGTGYTFEFRDVVSDSVLASYQVNILPFKCQTLAFYGNTNIGHGVMTINDY